MVVFAKSKKLELMTSYFSEYGGIPLSHLKQPVEEERATRTRLIEDKIRGDVFGPMIRRRDMCHV